MLYKHRILFRGKLIGFTFIPEIQGIGISLPYQLEEFGDFYKEFVEYKYLRISFYHSEIVLFVKNLKQLQLIEQHFEVYLYKEPIFVILH
jgi:hypothetical protein